MHVSGAFITFNVLRTIIVCEFLIEYFFIEIGTRRGKGPLSIRGSGKHNEKLSVKKPTLDEVATVEDVPKEDHAPKAIAPTPEQILAIKVFSLNQISAHTFLICL